MNQKKKKQLLSHNEKNTVPSRFNLKTGRVVLAFDSSAWKVSLEGKGSVSSVSVSSRSSWSME